MALIFYLILECINCCFYLVLVCSHCWKCDLNQGMTLEILSWNGRYFSVITLTAGHKEIVTIAKVKQVLLRRIEVKKEALCPCSRWDLEELRLALVM
ncbi:hypothetical protein Patl1_12294 [Pistacia atlantica]|uniref:Uncharacterized protein n=1 Tax=Pistacia atlantica TaxID=434234 RepID=A0ACC1A5Y5_9ROSI|nr:hypothetical protein Patl1_12294 [Pistacia atlantica]